MSFFVYIHTCPNGKKYVGVTKRTTEERWCDGEGYKGQKHFYAAIQKYGWDNIGHESFEVESSSLMLYWERILIYHHKTIDRKYGYNKSGGGECINGFYLSEEIRKKISETMKHRKVSEETKQKMSKTLTGRTSPMKGRTQSESARKKISEAVKNRPSRKLSEETKQKISTSLKGRISPLRGIKMSDDAKAKMSAAKVGKKRPPRSEEHCKKISEARKLYWENKRKNTI